MDHYVTPGNKYLDWSGFYLLINQCNDALVSLPKIMQKTQGTSLDSSFYKHIIGEVLWMRAWSYFTLIENWGDVPFYTDPIYSIDKITATKPVSEDSILDQLEKDLSWASKNVYINWAWGDTRIDRMWNHETVNMCAVIGLLGEILVYRNKFQEAWSQSVYLKLLTPQPIIPGDPAHAEDWHNSFNIDGGSLDGGKEWFNVMFRYDNEQYRSSWYEEGLILAFDTENTISGGGIYNERHTLGYFTNNRSEEGGLYYVKPSRSAVDMFKINGDVYRGNGYSVYVDFNTQLQTQDTLIWKYIGIDPNGGRRDPYRTYGNINILRVSDIYLKAAEVANRLGYSSTAIQIINQNRARVSVTNAFVKDDATVEEIEDAILDERALELAFEGQRWYDLVRIAKRRNDPNVLINRVLQNIPDSQKELVRSRLEFQAVNGWKLPYGTRAASVNPNLN
jgi:hypothetical protein